MIVSRRWSIFTDTRRLYLRTQAHAHAHPQHTRTSTTHTHIHNTHALPHHTRTSTTHTHIHSTHAHPQHTRTSTTHTHIHNTHERGTWVRHEDQTWQSDMHTHAHEHTHTSTHTYRTYKKEGHEFVPEFKQDVFTTILAALLRRALLQHQARLLLSCQHCLRVRACCVVL